MRNQNMANLMQNHGPEDQSNQRKVPCGICIARIRVQKEHEYQECEKTDVQAQFHAEQLSERNGPSLHAY